MTVPAEKLVGGVSCTPVPDTVAVPLRCQPVAVTAGRVSAQPVAVAPLPLSATLMAPWPVLGVTDRLPLAGPLAVGLKRTTWVTEPLAGTTVPTPTTGATALNGAPGRVTALRVRLLSPVLVSTTLAVALLPTVTEPKATLLGLTVRKGGSDAVAPPTRTLRTMWRSAWPPVPALKPSSTWLGRLTAVSSTWLPATLTCSRPLTTWTSTGTGPAFSRVGMAVLVDSQVRPLALPPLAMPTKLPDGSAVPLSNVSSATARPGSVP